MPRPRFTCPEKEKRRRSGRRRERRRHSTRTQGGGEGPRMGAKRPAGAGRRRAPAGLGITAQGGGESGERLGQDLAERPLCRSGDAREEERHLREQRAPREEERAAYVWGRSLRNVPYVGPEMPGRRRGISGIQRSLREEERATVSEVSVRREQGGGELPPVLTSPPREEERVANCWSVQLRCRCGGAREEERHRRQSQWPREEERAD